jgi:hypothetical protein
VDAEHTAQSRLGTRRGVPYHPSPPQRRRLRVIADMLGKPTHAPPPPFGLINFALDVGPPTLAKRGRFRLCDSCGRRQKDTKLPPTEGGAGDAS